MASLAKEHTNGEISVDPAVVGPEEIPRLCNDLEIKETFNHIMESLIKEAKRIRDASQNGTMEDDERQERTGDVAMALLNLIEQFGMEDDDDEDGASSTGHRLVSTQYSHFSITVHPSITNSRNIAK